MAMDHNGAWYQDTISHCLIILWLYAHILYIQTWTYANISQSYSRRHGTREYQLPFGLRILCDDPIVDIFHLWLPFIFKIYTLMHIAYWHFASRALRVWLCRNAYFFFVFNSAAYHFNIQGKWKENLNTRIRFVDFYR